VNKYYQIRDYCRQGLIKHLERVCDKKPRFINSKILDIGCDSGVPTIWLSKNIPGIISAMDSDSNSIDYLQQRINKSYLQHRIKTICQTFDEFIGKTGNYNLILAEGFLNVVGFEMGFKRVIEKSKLEAILLFMINLRIMT